MSIDSQIMFLTEQLRTADADNAYHHLFEIDAAFVPELIAAYHREGDHRIRVMLVEIIGEHRRTEDITFFADLLQSNSVDLWQAALDAFVKIGQPACVQALTDERNKLKEDSRKIAWIDEAIQQLDDLLADC